MQLGGAFKGFSYSDEKTIPITGDFSVTIRRAKSVQSYRLEMAKIQRRMATGPKGAAADEYLTGSYKGDVTLFHEHLLVRWTLKDAKTGKDIEADLETFSNICLGKVDGVTPTQGREFYDMLFQAAHENEFFHGDEDNLKNS